MTSELKKIIQEDEVLANTNRLGSIGCVFASGGCPRLSDFKLSPSAVSSFVSYIQTTPEKSCGELLGQLLECPSRTVLEETEKNGPLCGWKDGHLSKDAGFLPKDMSHLGNLHKFPGPSTWVTLAKRTPGLLSRNKFREAARQLQVQKADVASLPDYCLHEALTVLGIMVNSFRFEQRNMDDPMAKEDIPAAIMMPWAEVCTRVGRPGCNLGLQDVTFINARWNDVTRPLPDRWSMDNSQMFYPVFRTQTEHVFLMIFNEMLAKFSPAVEAMVKAQEAVIIKDNESLISSLLVIKSALDEQVNTFHKISVNKTVASMYCDPVQWAKTIAKWCAPWSAGPPPPPGISGLASPMFHALDCFLGRKDYSSPLGIEAMHIRKWMPPVHQRFFEALEAVSVGEYCYHESSITELKGIFDGILETYAGERGLLGTHRYKVYGFLELGFKTGRTSTNGGTLKAERRGWEVVHDILGKARIDRLSAWRQFSDITSPSDEIRGTFHECPFEARIKERIRITGDELSTTRRVVIDLKGTGITYLPGDRLAILPENPSSNVNDTLKALGIPRDTKVVVTGGWKDLFYPRITVDAIEIIKAARIRPLPRQTLEILSELCSEQKLTAKDKLSEALASMNQFHQETDWTLSQLVEAKLPNPYPFLDSNGDTPAQEEVKATLPFDPSVLCRMFQIERPRTYSISSAPISNHILPEAVDLTVSRQQRTLTTGEVVEGSGSGFLNPPIGAHDLNKDTSIRVGISRPLLFKLPDPNKPIVMFASGSGIGPFRAFLQQRMQDPLIGDNYLFFGVRDRKSIIYEEELANLVSIGQLHVNIAFSREDIAIDGVVDGKNEFKIVPGKRCYINAVMEQKANLEKLWNLMLPINVGGLGATVYVCGNIWFFRTVMRSLRTITVAKGLSKRDVVKDMFSYHRIQFEVFKTPTPFNYPDYIGHAELSKHNSSDKGFWMAISNKVYDVTKFMDLHPGGMAIVQANCGIDATHVFNQVAHGSNAEIVSLMDCFILGALLPVHFDSIAVEDAYQTLLTFLRRIVEMENTFQLDADSMDRSELKDARDLMDTERLRNMLDLHRRTLLTMLPSIGGEDLQLLIDQFTALKKNYCDKRKSMGPKETFGNLLRTYEGRCALHTIHVFKYLAASKDKDNQLMRRVELENYINSLLTCGRKFMFSVKMAVSCALQRLETFQTGDDLLATITGILRDLNSIAYIIKRYLSKIKEVLAARYYVKDEPTGKELWEKMKIRHQERCLILLAREGNIFEMLHQAEVAEEVFNSDALRIATSLHVASKKWKARAQLSSSERSRGLAGVVGQMFLKSIRK